MNGVPALRLKLQSPSSDARSKSGVVAKNLAVCRLRSVEKMNKAVAHAAAIDSSGLMSRRVCRIPIGRSVVNDAIDSLHAQMTMPKLQRVRRQRR